MLKQNLPPTNTTKALREFFGLSQQDFARYLSISRSTLSMIEIGEREVPGPALLKYAPLVALAFGKGRLAVQPTLLPPLTAAEKKGLEERATDCDIEAEKCRRQLAAMQKAYEQGSHALAMVAQLLPALPEGKKTKSERLLLERIQEEAAQKQQANGTAAQTLLQWKLDGLIDGAKRARAMMGE